MNGAEKTGVLIINLGTPDAPTPPAVGRYLKQFLMDKWVIDIPAILRWILVHILIVPKRKFASAEAYEKVWTKKGSPLYFHSQEFCAKVENHLGDKFLVRLGMRYGNPSIPAAIEYFKKAGVKELVVMPLYPQYAESSTRSSLEEVERALRSDSFSPRVKIVPPFFDSVGFIKAYAQEIRKSLAQDSHLLLSYHGLPERHVQKTDLTKNHCLKSPNCCDKMVDANRFCYRAHSFATSRALATELGLSKNQYSVSFQSRLGRAPWIKPYTDFLYKDLIAEGKKNIVVASPSFVADCLETIEELGMRLREDFIRDGGEKFDLVPCLNSSDPWVHAATDLIVRFARS